MDDALKIFSTPNDGFSQNPLPDDQQSNPNEASPARPDPSESRQESLGERKLDRWFLEQRGNKRVPKRLNIPNEMLVCNAGPLKMKGNITLIDEDGSITHANNLSFCRCGASKNQPFCDDQHLEIEFFDNGSVQRISDWMEINRPQTIRMTCVKNGPLLFRGYLRIYNKKGQEHISMKGALCRCGKSSKKPFCDNATVCAGS